jgi:hypothetical protein
VTGERAHQLGHAFTRAHDPAESTTHRATARAAPRKIHRQRLQRSRVAASRDTDEHLFDGTLVQWIVGAERRPRRKLHLLVIERAGAEAMHLHASTAHHQFTAAQIPLVEHTGVMDQGSEKLTTAASVWLPLDVISPMDGVLIIGGKPDADTSIVRDPEDESTLDKSTGEPAGSTSCHGRSPRATRCSTTTVAIPSDIPSRTPGITGASSHPRVRFSARLRALSDGRTLRTIRQPLQARKVYDKRGVSRSAPERGRREHGESISCNAAVEYLAA